MIWIAEAVVTFQIKLLGGNMYVKPQLTVPPPTKLTSPSQLLLPIRLHHRLHAIPARHRRAAERPARPCHRADTRLQRAGSLVARGRRQHSGWQRRGEEQGLAGRVPALRLLHWPGLPLLHLLVRTLLKDSHCTIDHKFATGLAFVLLPTLPLLLAYTTSCIRSPGVGQNTSLQLPHIARQSVHIQVPHLLSHRLRPALKNI